jgi:hypothetical protein
VLLHSSCQRSLPQLAAGALCWWTVSLWSWRTCLHAAYTPRMSMTAAACAGSALGWYGSVRKSGHEGCVSDGCTGCCWAVHPPTHTHTPPPCLQFHVQPVWFLPQCCQQRWCFGKGPKSPQTRPHRPSHAQSSTWPQFLRSRCGSWPSAAENPIVGRKMSSSRCGSMPIHICSVAVKACVLGPAACSRPMHRPKTCAAANSTVADNNGNERPS